MPHNGWHTETLNDPCSFSFFSFLFSYLHVLIDGRIMIESRYFSISLSNFLFIVFNYSQFSSYFTFTFYFYRYQYGMNRKITHRIEVFIVQYFLFISHLFLFYFYMYQYVMNGEITRKIEVFILQNLMYYYLFVIIVMITLH